MYQVKNLTEVELASGNIDSDDTTMALASGEGASLPTTSGGAYELVIWDSSYASPIAAYQAGRAEVVLVSSHDGVSDSLTIVRAQGGTSAVDFSGSGICNATLDFTKTLYDYIVDRIDSPKETGTAFDSSKLYLPSTKSPTLDFISMGTFSQQANRYYATPWIAPADGTIGECKIQKFGTPVSSANMRIGFFSPTSRISSGIGTLIEQSGVIAAANDASGDSSHWVWTPSALTVKKNHLYWVVCNSDTTVSVVGSTQSTSGSWQTVLGFTCAAYNTILALCGYQNGFTFGAFGDPFDGTLDTDNGARPIVWINYSA